MSGIAGVYYFDSRLVESRTLEVLAKSLMHRGPDGSGIWSDGSVGFVHLLLWTTPESLTEKQPLVKRAGELTITADARIDNRDDLFLMLDMNRSSEIGDSELILAAYAKWGEDCPGKLVGDFAFAIWDKQKRALFAARDRIGVKPFYYYHEDGREFVFASEISPIFDGISKEKRPDREAIRELIATSDLPVERTLFDGIRRLPPASTLAVRNGRVSIRKYWRPEYYHEHRPSDLEADAEEFRHLLSQSVKAQMRSAFPLGAHLSGGLDSSSVVCLASRLADRARPSLSAFSLVFDRLPCDEREFILEVVRSADVEWASIVADQPDADDWELLKAYYARCSDWPTLEFGNVALWPLTVAARNKGIRVMLTGFGGDNVCQGSPYYLTDLLSQRRFGDLMSEFEIYRSAPRTFLGFMLKPLIPLGILNRVRRLKGTLDDIRIFPHRDIHDELASQRGGSPARDDFPTLASWHEANAVSAPAISRYFDSSWDLIGAHCEIEFRHPFFDTRLVEFALSLPPQEKLSRGVMKIVMRHGMKGILPEKIRRRMDKAEFSAVISAALERDRPRGESCLGGDDLLGARKLAQFEARRVGDPSRWMLPAWRLACLEVWYGALGFNTRMEGVRR